MFFRFAYLRLYLRLGHRATLAATKQRNQLCARKTPTPPFSLTPLFTTSDFCAIYAAHENCDLMVDCYPVCLNQDCIIHF